MKKLSCVLFALCLCAVATAQDIGDFVKQQLVAYPQSRLLDIYKSCFQDCMGAEHLVNDTASARAYLAQELVTTNAADYAPEYVEHCGIEGNYVRVSLRAVHDGHISADTLLDAFIASANAGRPTVEQWTEQWHQIVAQIDKMQLGLNEYEQDRQFIEDVLAQGKYAISHSPDYREAYSPHYRIIKRDIYERELKPLLPCCYCH